MAREKKKVDPPVDGRFVEEVAAVDFSGLGGDAPAVGIAPPKVRAQAKPRPRKTPAPPPDVSPAPAPTAGVGSAPEPSAPAREAAALLESIVLQCREAQSQLQGELEKRRNVEREAEELRKRSQEAHAQDPRAAPRCLPHPDRE